MGACGGGGADLIAGPHTSTPSGVRSRDQRDAHAAADREGGAPEPEASPGRARGGLRGLPDAARAWEARRGGGGEEGCGVSGGAAREREEACAGDARGGPVRLSRRGRRRGAAGAACVCVLCAIYQVQPGRPSPPPIAASASTCAGRLQRRQLRRPTGRAACRRRLARTRRSRMRRGSCSEGGRRGRRGDMRDRTARPIRSTRGADQVVTQTRWMEAANDMASRLAKITAPAAAVSASRVSARGSQPTKYPGTNLRATQPCRGPWSWPRCPGA